MYIYFTFIVIFYLYLEFMMHTGNTELCHRRYAWNDEPKDVLINLKTRE